MSIESVDTVAEGLMGSDYGVPVNKESDWNGRSVVVCSDKSDELSGEIKGSIKVDTDGKPSGEISVTITFEDEYC